ncbi:hypothetical protein M409DRAFT_20275 [Zasmidium cellare ATCC 36951]|uniref:Uncharacterized protein n=1 Tax=Zasmidium cellare ATCC 36951 TaxID=1080233 RepID=A0A6A6CRZ9_ZASCE|nr:uncharacterized protein M409DRAFT_20275 [Zasmidium cellare ATCC 36951]KAF2169861.1 hypothetical protein M409DRAFT_20275 [Zasmidium cellare ATCC 36951]
MAAKTTKARDKQRAAAGQPPPQPDHAARSAHQAQRNQSLRLAQPRQPSGTPQQQLPLLPPPQRPPPVRHSPHKPMVRIDGRLQLDGAWNLQCYEFKYVTEHLQLHRFPIDRDERRKESEPAEQFKATRVNISNGVIPKPAAEVNTASGEKPKGKEVSGLGAAGGRSISGGGEVGKSSQQATNEPQLNTMEEMSANTKSHPSTENVIAADPKEPEQRPATPRSASYGNANAKTTSQEAAAKDVPLTDEPVVKRKSILNDILGPPGQLGGITAARDSSMRAGLKFSVSGLRASSSAVADTKVRAGSEAPSWPPTSQQPRNQPDVDYDESSEGSSLEGSEEEDEEGFNRELDNDFEKRRSKMLSIADMANREEETPTRPKQPQNHKTSPKRKLSSVSSDASDYYNRFPDSDDPGESAVAEDHGKDKQRRPSFNEQVFDESSPSKRRRTSSPVPPERTTVRVKKEMVEGAEMDVGKAMQGTSKKGKKTGGLAAGGRGRGGKGKGRLE